MKEQAIELSDAEFLRVENRKLTERTTLLEQNLPTNRLRFSCEKFLQDLLLFLLVLFVGYVVINIREILASQIFWSILEFICEVLAG